MNSPASSLLAGFLLDLCLGDPRCLPHPIRGFGALAGKLESFGRKAGRRMGLRWAGIGFALVAIGAAASVVGLSLRAASLWSWAAEAVAVYWIYAMLALRDLDAQAGAVVRRLGDGDLPGARKQLANIVGRDTENLEEPEILRAAIETVSENLSDGVVAPLLYFGLAGPVGMAVYKAANTLDSLVGYTDERYLEFGWASARIDDALNFLPARISAGLIWAAAGLLGLNLPRSVSAVWSDASKQPSPNAGYPEAAVAGALGIRLGGLNYYRGVARVKPFLGEPIHPLSARTFQQARKILYASSVFMAAAVTGWLAASGG